MFNIPKGEPITESRLARAQRQFGFLQRRGAGVPERVKGVAAGQQLGLLKLGKKSPEGHPHKLLLPTDTLAQVQVELMKKQIHPRMAGGGYAGLGLGLNPYVEDRSGEMRRQEEHGLRTPYGVSMTPQQGLLRMVESPYGDIRVAVGRIMGIITRPALTEGTLRFSRDPRGNLIPIADID